jgi:hypothetical protein
MLPLEAQHLTSPKTSVLLAGLMCNLLAFCVAAELLFALGRVVLAPSQRFLAAHQAHQPVAGNTDRSREAPSQIALLAAYLFCITPAGIFMSALYTER